MRVWRLFLNRKAVYSDQYSAFGILEYGFAFEGGKCLITKK